MKTPRPFLQWVGGKTRLLPEIRKHLPAYSGAYYEPFLGGGALFFDHNPNMAFLYDINEELINCWVVVRDHVEALINLLKLYPDSKEAYYAVRDVDPSTLEPLAQAARMIYLNRTCFGALYRVNAKGKFNVSYGGVKKRTICDEVNLRACSERLQGVSIGNLPFESVLNWAGPDDLVYFDPPYVPTSETSDFTSYTAEGFGLEEHTKLAEAVGQLTERRTFVLLSNSDTPWVRAIYDRYQIHAVEVQRPHTSRHRKEGLSTAKEVLISNEQLLRPSSLKDYVKLLEARIEGLERREAETRQELAVLKARQWPPAAEDTPF